MKRPDIIPHILKPHYQLQHQWIIQASYQSRTTSASTLSPTASFRGASPIKPAAVIHANPAPKHIEWNPSQKSTTRGDINLVLSKASVKVGFSAQWKPFYVISRLTNPKRRLLYSLLCMLLPAPYVPKRSRLRKRRARMCVILSWTWERSGAWWAQNPLTSVVYRLESIGLCTFVCGLRLGKSFAGEDWVCIGQFVRWTWVGRDFIRVRG